VKILLKLFVNLQEPQPLLILIFCGSISPPTFALTRGKIIFVAVITSYFACLRKIFFRLGF